MTAVQPFYVLGGAAMFAVYPLPYHPVYTGETFSGVTPARIETYPWDKGGYRPKAYAAGFYSDEGLHFQLNALEPDLRATYTVHGAPVYKDSCLELFVNPCPETDGRYLNFEYNPLGTLLLGCGTSVHARTDLSGRAQELAITPRVRELGGLYAWSVSFRIPFSLLQSLYPAFDPQTCAVMAANFYKCGDETPHPHFGCWNPIPAGPDTSPTFHCPEAFGRLFLMGRGASCRHI